MTSKAILSLALLSALFLAGCGKEEPKGDSYDTPYARMHDPDYLKAIDAKKEEQKAIMREIVAVRKEIGAYQKAHPGAAVPAELQAKLQAAADRMAASRKAAQELIRERIVRENAAVEKRQQNLKKDK